MKKISEMTGEELGIVLVNTFGTDPCDLEDGGYIEDVLSDEYPRSEIQAVSTDTWEAAWNFFEARK